MDDEKYSGVRFSKSILTFPGFINVKVYFLDSAKDYVDQLKLFVTVLSNYLLMRLNFICVAEFNEKILHDLCRVVNSFVCLSILMSDLCIALDRV